MNYITEYHNAIQRSDIVTSRRVKAVYARLAGEVGNTDGNYRFDIDKATRPITFIETFCKHSKSVFDGVQRVSFCKRAGIDKASLYYVLRGDACRRQNAEKIAAALEMPFDKVFADVTKKPGLSGASVNKIKLNLSAIFTAAVKKEIMRRNPCKLVTPPKVDTPPAAFYDEEQARQLLKAAHACGDFQLETIINLFLATGIRAGELTALWWPDLDFDTGVLFVQHTLVRIDGEFVRQTTKTADSTRRLILPGYILTLLREHKRRQADYLASLGGTRKSSDDIMFTNLHGDYFNAINLNRKLKDVIKAAGLPDIHLHSLRHTHASLLINSDVTAMSADFMHRLSKSNFSARSRASVRLFVSSNPCAICLYVIRLTPFD